MPAIYFGRIFDVSNAMKKLLPFLFLLGAAMGGELSAQQLTLKKGTIMSSIPVSDSIPESYSLYLPKSFDNKGRWPVVFVFDMDGKSKQALHMFAEAAEEHGYILASSDNVSDSLSLSKNVLIASRMFGAVFKTFPINNRRAYTAGFSFGAKFASAIPTFVKQIEGVISCGSPVPNTELLTNKRPFHFVGIVGKEDFNYSPLRSGAKVLNRLKFPNQLLTFEGGHEWPPKELISRAMEILKLSAMAKGNTPTDDQEVLESYQERYQTFTQLRSAQKMLQAHDLVQEMVSVYRPFYELDSLASIRKTIRRDKFYRAQKRNENNILFREGLIKEDYLYYLEEDLLTYNFNNLGWWNYQMGKLRQYEKSTNSEEKMMGERLSGFINALIEDNIDIINEEKLKDEEGLLFLWMLKTITAPKEYDNYLNIISLSSKYEDYGTSIFYLEELLKNGYKNKAALYELEHTALFRISPEFNEIVNKYLKDARYDVIEE